MGGWVGWRARALVCRQSLCGGWRNSKGSGKAVWSGGQGWEREKWQRPRRASVPCRVLCVSCRPSVLTAAGGANAVNADGVAAGAAAAADAKPPAQAAGTAAAAGAKPKAGAAAKGLADKKRSLKRL